MTARQIQLGDITFANNHPFVLLGGVNVLEDLDFALHCAGHYKQVCERLGSSSRSSKSRALFAARALR